MSRRTKAKPAKAKAKRRHPKAKPRAGRAAVKAGRVAGKGRAGAGKARRTAGAKKSAVRLSVALGADMIRQVERQARAAGVTRDQYIAGCVRFGLSGASSRLPFLPPYTSAPADDGASRDVGAGLDQVLTWMADQQAVLTQIRDSLAEVTAAVPIDTRPPAPEPGDDDDDEPRRRRLSS